MKNTLSVKVDRVFFVCEDLGALPQTLRSFCKKIDQKLAIVNYYCLHLENLRMQSRKLHGSPKESEARVKDFACICNIPSCFAARSLTRDADKNTEKNLPYKKEYAKYSLTMNKCFPIIAIS